MSQLYPTSITEALKHGVVRYSDFIPVALIEEKMPITREQLLRAMKRGELIKGHHYVEAKKSGSNKYLYHPERILMLLPEIKVPARVKRPGRRKRVVKLPVVSSKRKRVLAGHLSTFYFQEQACYQELERIAKKKKTYENLYWEIKWELTDCPHCGGTGRLEGNDCGMCL